MFAGHRPSVTVDRPQSCNQRPPSEMLKFILFGNLNISLSVSYLLRIKNVPHQRWKGQGGQSPDKGGCHTKPGRRQGGEEINQVIAPGAISLDNWVKSGNFSVEKLAYTRETYKSAFEKGVLPRCPSSLLLFLWQSAFSGRWGKETTRRKKKNVKSKTCHGQQFFSDN